MSNADQYQKASNVVRARLLDSHPVLLPDFIGAPGIQRKGVDIEYTLVMSSFEV